MVDAPVLRQRPLRRLTLWFAVPLAALWLYCQVVPFDKPSGDWLAVHNQFGQFADRYERALTREDWEALAALYRDRHRATSDIARWKQVLTKTAGFRVVGRDGDGVASVPLIGTIGTRSVNLSDEHGFVSVTVKYSWGNRDGWKVISSDILSRTTTPIVVQNHDDMNLH